MGKRLVAAALVGAMLVSGCGSQSVRDATAATTTADASTTTANTTAATSTTTAGSTPSTTALSVSAAPCTSDSLIQVILASNQAPPDVRITGFSCATGYAAARIATLGGDTATTFFKDEGGRWNLVFLGTSGFSDDGVPASTQAALIAKIDPSVPSTSSSSTTIAAGSSTAATPVEISAAMSSTYETDDRSTTFVPVGQPAIVADGNGGYLTAAIGVRSPSADGKGMLVFFFDNGTFLGWDTVYESNAIDGVTGVGTGTIEASYSTYGPSDALCCPSGSATVAYVYSGAEMQPQTAVPPAALSATHVSRG